MTARNSAPKTPATPMTHVAASRIQSATSKANSGIVSKGTFASRAQSTAAKGGKH